MVNDSYTIIQDSTVKAAYLQRISEAKSTYRDLLNNLPYWPLRKSIFDKDEQTIRYLAYSDILVTLGHWHYIVSSKTFKVVDRKRLEKLFEMLNENPHHSPTHKEYVTCIH